MLHDTRRSSTVDPPASSARFGEPERPEMASERDPIAGIRGVIAALVLDSLVILLPRAIPACQKLAGMRELSAP
jgi:hypothetical protein